MTDTKMLRRMYPSLTDDDMQLFLYHVERTGLDPLARQIFPVARWDKTKGREALSSIQATIDGFRLIAERSGKYAGQDGPYWCGPDGEWKDVWLSNEPPVAAKVGILRSDFSAPCWGVARFDAYSQTKKDGTLNPFWARMGDVMIAKCAEALAMRKAFPHELSGIYTADEMAQSETEPAPRISQDAANSLHARLTKCGADMTAFCRYFGIASVDDLPESRLAEANALIARKEEANVAKN